MDVLSVDILPTGGRNDRRGNTGGGDICLPPPEHGRIVHCYRAHYGPVSGDRAKTKGEDIQAVLRTERVGCERNVDGGSGGRMDRRGGEDGKDRYIDRYRDRDKDRDRDIDIDRDTFNLCKNNTAIITVETKSNDLLVYALGFEHHHPIISTLG